MPIYDYVCLECEKKFAIRHSVKKVIKECEECEGKLKRVINFSNLRVSSKKEGNILDNLSEAQEDLKNLKKAMKSKKNEL